MAFENPYLVDFAPVFYEIIRQKAIHPGKVEVFVFDEETGESHPFEWTDVRDVLYQLGDGVNALTIYTERPEYFLGFAERMYEENGLLVVFAPKKEQKRMQVRKQKDWIGIVLDFERKGHCYNIVENMNCGYIPIHKKPWEMAENLDIRVPFGYNTVIVKSKYTNDKKFVRDRFDEGFYRDE